MPIRTAIMAIPECPPRKITADIAAMDNPAKTDGVTAMRRVAGHRRVRSTAWARAPGVHDRPLFGEVFSNLVMMGIRR